jgi:hypothetical protein
LVCHTEERIGMRAFENKVLRKISWPKRDEVAGSWKRIYNE